MLRTAPLLAFLLAPAAAFACHCGVSACLQHCPAEALANPGASLEQIDAWVHALESLPPEQRAQVGSVLHAAKELRSAVGDTTFGGTPGWVTLKQQANERISVTSAMDEARVQAILGGAAVARPPGDLEGTRAVNDAGWHDLVRDRLSSAPSVSVSFPPGGGPPTIERSPPPRADAPPIARPAIGVRAAPASSASSAPEGVPSAPMALDPPARARAEAAVEKAGARPIPVKPASVRPHAPPPPPPPSSPKEQAGQQSAAEKFYRDRVEEFRKFLHGVGKAPAGHAPAPVSTSPP